MNNNVGDYDEQRQEPQEHERTTGLESGSNQQRHRYSNSNEDNVIHILGSPRNNNSGSVSSNYQSRKSPPSIVNSKSKSSQSNSAEVATEISLKQYQSRGSGPSPTPSQQSAMSSAYMSVSSSRYQQNRSLSSKPEKGQTSESYQTTSVPSINSNIQTQQSMTSHLHHPATDQHPVMSNNSTMESIIQNIERNNSGIEQSQSINNRSIPPVRSSGLESHRSHESNKSSTSSGPDKMSLQRTVQQQTTDLQTLQDELAAIHQELTATKQSLKDTNAQLADTQDQLQQSRSECHGLQTTLGDLMEQHEQMKKHSTNTHDRLASLSISLTSMREQQDVLSATVTRRNDNYQTVTAKRRDLLAQLQTLDEELVSEEDKLGTALQKQTREMEAIAAVINAARCD